MKIRALVLVVVLMCLLVLLTPVAWARSGAMDDTTLGKIEKLLGTRTYGDTAKLPEIGDLKTIAQAIDWLANYRDNDLGTLETVTEAYMYYLEYAKSKNLGATYTGVNVTAPLTQMRNAVTKLAANATYYYENITDRYYGLLNTLATLNSADVSDYYTPREQENLWLEVRMKSAQLEDLLGDLNKTCAEDATVVESQLRLLYGANEIVPQNVDETLADFDITRYHAIYQFQMAVLAEKEKEMFEFSKSENANLNNSDINIVVLDQYTFVIKILDSQGRPISLDYEPKVTVTGKRGSKAVRTKAVNKDGYASFSVVDFAPNTNNIAGIEYFCQTNTIFYQKFGELSIDVKGGERRDVKLMPGSDAPYISMMCYNGRDIMRTETTVFRSKANDADQSFFLRFENIPQHNQSWYRQPLTLYSGESGMGSNRGATQYITKEGSNGGTVTFTDQWLRYLKYDESVSFRFGTGGLDHKFFAHSFKVVQGRDDGSTTNPRDDLAFTPGFTIALPNNWPIVGGSKYNISPPILKNYIIYFDVSGKFVLGFTKQIDGLGKDFWKSSNAQDFGKKQKEIEDKSYADQLRTLKGIATDAAGKREWGLIGQFKLTTTISLCAHGTWAWQESARNYGEMTARLNAALVVGVKVSVAKTIFAGPVPVLLGLDFSPSIGIGLNALNFKWNIHKENSFKFEPIANLRVSADGNAGASIGLGLASLASASGRVFLFVGALYKPFDNRLEKAVLGMGIELNIEVVFVGKATFKIWEPKPWDLLSPGAEFEGYIEQEGDSPPALPWADKNGNCDYDVDANAPNANEPYADAVTKFTMNVTSLFDAEYDDRSFDSFTSLGAPFTEEDIIRGKAVGDSVKIVKFNRKLSGFTYGYAFWIGQVHDGVYTYTRVYYAGFSYGEGGTIYKESSGFIEPPRVNGTFLYYAVDFDVDCYYETVNGVDLPRVALSIVYNNAWLNNIESIDIRKIPSHRMSDMSVQTLLYTGLKDIPTNKPFSDTALWRADYAWLQTNEGKPEGDYRYFYAPRVVAIDNPIGGAPPAMVGCAAHTYNDYWRVNEQGQREILYLAHTTIINAVELTTSSINRLKTNQAYESDSKYSLYGEWLNDNDATTFDLASHTFMLAKGKDGKPNWASITDIFERQRNNPASNENIGLNNVWRADLDDYSKHFPSIYRPVQIPGCLVSIKPYLEKDNDGKFYHGGTLGILRTLEDDGKGGKQPRYTLTERKIEPLNDNSSIKTFKMTIRNHDFSLATPTYYYGRDYNTGQIITSWTQRFEDPKDIKKPAKHVIMASKYFEERGADGNITFAGFTKPFELSEVKTPPTSCYWLEIGNVNGRNQYLYVNNRARNRYDNDFAIVTHQFNATNKLEIVGLSMDDTCVHAGEIATFAVALKSVGSWPLYKATLTFTAFDTATNAKKDWEAKVEINLRAPKTNTMEIYTGDGHKLERDYHSIYRLPSWDFMSDVYVVKTTEYTLNNDKVSESNLSSEFMYSRVILPSEILTIACQVPIPTAFGGDVTIKVAVGGEQAPNPSEADNSSNFGYIWKDGKFVGSSAYDALALTAYEPMNNTTFDLLSADAFDTAFNNLDISAELIDVEGVKTVQATVRNRAGMLAPDGAPTFVVSVDGVQTYAHKFINSIPWQNVYNFSAPLTEITGGQLGFDQLILGVAGHGNTMRDTERSIWDILYAGEPDENGVSAAPKDYTFNEFNPGRNRIIFGADTYFRIIEQPQTAWVEIDQCATFSVKAYGGTYPHHYRWQFRPDPDSYWQDIVGATTAAYTTPPAQEEHDGYEFRCIVSDSAPVPASEDSDPAQLRIIKPPITGDNRRLDVLMLLLTASFMACIGIYRINRKRKGN